MSNIDLKALVERFDEAAQAWGWEADQGFRNVEAARAEYNAAKSALLDRLEAAEKERDEQRQAIAAIVHAAGGKIRVGPATLMKLRSLTLTRYDDPATCETVFQVAAMAQEGGK